MPKGFRHAFTPSAFRGALRDRSLGGVVEVLLSTGELAVNAPLYEICDRACRQGYGAVTPQEMQIVDEWNAHTPTERIRDCLAEVFHRLQSRPSLGRDAKVRPVLDAIMNSGNVTDPVSVLASLEKNGLVRRRPKEVPAAAAPATP